MNRRTETIVREAAAKLGGLHALQSACLYLALRDEWQQARVEDPFTERTFKGYVNACQECAADDRADSVEAVIDDYNDAYKWHRKR